MAGWQTHLFVFIVFERTHGHLWRDKWTALSGPLSVLNLCLMPGAAGKLEGAKAICIELVFYGMAGAGKQEAGIGGKTKGGGVLGWMAHTLVFIVLNVCLTPGGADKAKGKGGGVLGWMASTLGRGRDASAKDLLAREDLFPRDAAPTPSSPKGVGAAPTPPTPQPQPHAPPLAPPAHAAQAHAPPAVFLAEDRRTWEGRPASRGDTGRPSGDTDRPRGDHGETTPHRGDSGAARDGATPQKVAARPAAGLHLLYARYRSYKVLEP